MPAGSWSIFGVNLPEFGVTEALGSAFGSPRSSSGGSNVVPNKPLLSGVPQSSVLGATDQVYSPPDFGQNAVVDWNANKPKTGGGGTNPFTGSVLGAQAPTQPQAPQGPSIPDIMDQQNADIQNRFSDFINQLGGQQNELQGLAQNQAQTQKQGIDTALAEQRLRFPQYQQQVNQNADLALRDLAQRGNQYQMAANTRLGLSGAGDSSGADMYKYALGKAQSRNEAGVYRDRNSQLQEISLAEEETIKQAESQKNDVDSWLNNQISTIAQQFQGMANQLRGQSIDVRRQAYDQYLSYLGGLEQQANQYRMQLQQNVQSRMQALNDAKLQLSQSANFDPRQIVTQEINAMPQAMSQAEMQFVNPFIVRDEERNRMFS